MGNHVHKDVLLITPPFTQLNTPYPAMSYLQGYLNTLGVTSYQSDLSLETALKLFTKQILSEVFQTIPTQKNNYTPNIQQVIKNQRQYIQCIEPVIQFLQGNNDALAFRILNGKYLPKGHRSPDYENIEWAFGELGNHDKAKYLATLYLEELGDFIQDVVDENFGFSRYAERLARTASGFDELYHNLLHSKSIIVEILQKLIAELVEKHTPKMVFITAPFPGNVFGAFQIAKTVKSINPEIICALGGGYANTELRSVYDERVFEFFDYIILDDGELPVKQLVERHIKGVKGAPLKRCFHLVNGIVQFSNDCKDFDIPQKEVGTPNYSDLKWGQYISVLEMLNPMHKLWSDGKWNKLTLAHGCYWGKCTFCDISLDYIQRYEPIEASVICDRIETIIHQTGVKGFHFVDEAAPPALLKELAIELLKRGITISWWTNIRFEKTFSKDLCRLLAASGCIAVTGGLEVASDRLLQFMKKGVTVEQVTNVCHSFTENGIMVHAYLMYGFPTQTAEETIDSLEVVRQMMENNLVQSGFWHQFAMTAHSPIGISPEVYHVVKTGPDFLGFAENDCFHEDPKGADHEMFSEGLRTSMYNFMTGAGFDIPLRKWFSFTTPKTSLPKNYIQNFIQRKMEEPKPNHCIYWSGMPFDKKNSMKDNGSTFVVFYIQNEVKEILMTDDIADFILKTLSDTDLYSRNMISLSFAEWKVSFESSVTSLTWEEFIQSFVFYQLREVGLLIL